MQGRPEQGTPRACGPHRPSSIACAFGEVSPDRSGPVASPGLPPATSRRMRISTGDSPPARGSGSRPVGEVAAHLNFPDTFTSPHEGHLFLGPAGPAGPGSLGYRENKHHGPASPWPDPRGQVPEAEALTSWPSSSQGPGTCHTHCLLRSPSSSHLLSHAPEAWPLTITADVGSHFHRALSCHLVQHVFSLTISPGWQLIGALGGGGSGRWPV